MKKFKKKAIIDENYCVACGCCASMPSQIIHIDQGVIAKINYNKCIGCGKCAKLVLHLL